ncbi:MAG: alpha/beta hydrolase fold domain-containing protein [Microthrixaceae bacterium]
MPVASSRLLRQGVLHAVLALNARRPVHRNRVLTIPSFFGSWLVTEAAPAWLALWVARSGRELVRNRGRIDAADAVGLGLTAGAAASLVGQMLDAARAEEELRAALSGEVPAEHLDARPGAVRRGGFLPWLNGRSRRRRTRGVVFSELGTHRLKLDVYEPLDPPAPGRLRPAIIQIHGGAWILGSKDEQGVPLLNHLAANGWVGFNVEYRLSPRAKFPTHLIDCKAALAWIREHAADYGVDPDFICVTGGSAGGHLTALMALTENDPAFQPGFEDADTSVQAAVPFYGVYDLLDREQDQLDTFLRFLEEMVMGSHPESDPEGWAAYSPIDRIHGDAPPMMVIHGDNDVLVPVAGARRFAARLRSESANPVVYAELHGAQHAFEVFPSIRTVRTVEYVERFLSWVHGRYLATRE